MYICLMISIVRLAKFFSSHGGAIPKKIIYEWILLRLQSVTVPWAGLMSPCTVINRLIFICAVFFMTLTRVTT